MKKAVARGATFDNHVEFQTAPGVYRMVLGKYYNSLLDRDKPFIKKTQDVSFLPYLSTVDQVCDFIGFQLTGCVIMCQENSHSAAYN